MAKPSSERVLISFDWALKRLLRQKAHYGILEGFLTELLGFDVKVINLIESEGNKEYEDGKHNQVDLLCENEGGELVLIEVQYHSEIDYFQRMLFGTSKLITEYLKEGNPYAKVRKVYSVNILYFDIGQGKDYIYRGRTIFKGIHLNDELQLGSHQRTRFEKDTPSDIYPEYFILKINNFDKVAVDTLDEWIYYLQNNKLPERYHAKGLKEVEEKLKYEQMEPAEKKRYKKYIEGTGLSRSAYETALFEGREKGIEEGIEKGIKKGREKGIEEGMEKGRSEVQRQIVLSSFKKGLSPKLIAEIVEISIEEVERIIREG